ncbi:MAG TPA: hypothetical protein VFK82_06000, partial [Burkholderiaceae bacterium]|nr:hypothetical protein [Burkholderiaceae bacterium]
MNYYLEADPTGRGKFILYPTPGSVAVATLPSPVIAMEQAGDSVIAVTATGIYRIRANYTFALLRNITAGPDAYIAATQDRALVVTGGVATGINLGDWTTFSPTLPFTPATCTVLNGYFIANEVGT